MKTKTTLWDAAEHLKTKEDMAAYMACALEEGDSALIAAALGDIARAQGMMTEHAVQDGSAKAAFREADLFYGRDAS